MTLRFPAEWEPHDATWLVWPQNRTDWPGKFAPIPWVYCELIRHISRGERVHLVVNDADVETKAKDTLRRAHVPLEAVIFHRWPTNRGWTRDSGPIFVRRGKKSLAVTDWRFNAWAKYNDWRLDDQLPARAARYLKLPAIQPTAELDGKRTRVVLEGGSIDVNGDGLLLTTEECLLSEVQQRNPGLGRSGIERVFADYLGIEKVLWLDRGIAGDDTHGHIDDIARFVARDTIVACVEPDRASDNHEPLAENLRRLRSMTDQRGRPLRVLELPMPAPVFFRGQRLPASYANFYIANAAVIVPTFNDPNDRVALDILADCFRDRPVVPIYCGDLVLGLGTLHCMTQQQPA
jgi:agmatine deiminase